MATAIVAPRCRIVLRSDDGQDMSRISEATLIKPVDWRRESFSLEHLDSELLEQLIKDPWDFRHACQKAERLKLVLRGRGDLSHNSEIALFVNSGRSANI